MTVQNFRYELDVHRGVLEREVSFRDGADREFTLTSRRFVHMDKAHLAGIEWVLTAHNWAGRIEIDSAIDGTVINDGVDRYRALNGHHLEVLGTESASEDTICLTCRTVQSQIRACQAVRTRVFHGEEPAAAERAIDRQERRIAQRITTEIERSKPLRIEKIAAFHTSFDHAISEATAAARHTIARTADFKNCLLRANSAGSTSGITPTSLRLRFE